MVNYTDVNIKNLFSELHGFASRLRTEYFFHFFQHCKQLFVACSMWETLCFELQMYLPIAVCNLLSTRFFMAVGKVPLRRCTRHNIHSNARAFFPAG